MKLYKLMTYDPDIGQMLKWFSNKRDAYKELNRFCKENESQGPNMVECVEIPTDKSHLIDWLNKNFTTDNG